MVGRSGHFVRTGRREEIVAGLVPENFVGRAPQQVEEFIANVLKPIFDANPDAVEQHASLSV